jgi:hypothetical protein
MWWVLGAVVKTSDQGGSGKGWVDFVIILLYVSVAAFVVVSWARWMIRQRRGVVQWGESDSRARALRRPVAPLRRSARAQVGEHDEHEQAAG